MSFGIDASTEESYKAQWDALRGRGNHLDYERAVFLYNVLVEALHENMESLAGWIVAGLEEYAGRRVQTFLRMVNALDVIDDEDLWSKVGGKSIILLSRVNSRHRRAIIRRIDTIIRRTGRDCISESSVRNLIQEVAGVDGYAAACPESRHPRMNYRAQCVIYQQAILHLLNTGTINRTDLPRAVRTLLRLDGPTRRRRATAA